MKDIEHYKNLLFDVIEKMGQVRWLFSKNPDDEDTYIRGSQPETKGHNQLHVNALYDVMNRIYVDATVQGQAVENECRACVEMLDRTKIPGRPKGAASCTCTIVSSSDNRYVPSNANKAVAI
ncbi:MAG: hypothetical protein LUG56_04915 [Lachnospiraceae bacterium]|nr:hypothetical protein [Lachnospiraceae bacterium]